MKVEIGDWVRFYNGGKLVIGVVEYVRKKVIHVEYCTDAGTVHEDSVLEVRKNPNSDTQTIRENANHEDEI